MKIRRKPTRVHTRKLDRLVAHTNMKRKRGYHLNKGPRHESFFAKHWREYV